MSFDSLLVHTCYIAAPTSSQNSLGEWKYSWSYSSTGTVCRVQPITDTERIQSPGRFDNVVSRIYFKSTETIALGNRIKYGDEFYQIVDLRFDSSAHHRQALVMQL
jgi:hypothetical protein